MEICEKSDSYVPFLEDISLDDNLWGHQRYSERLSVWLL